MYYDKYQKYKSKYLGSVLLMGGSLEHMPKLCLGALPHRGNAKILANAIEDAFVIGYRHIDGADSYQSFAEDNYYGEMKLCLANLIRHYGRDNIWITWKTDEITSSNISDIVKKLGCDYLNLVLKHHGCPTEAEMETLVMLRTDGVCHQIGVSNCYDLSTLLMYKSIYNIFANQIQARPPRGKIQGLGKLQSDFVTICNENKINIMFYSPWSGLVNSEDFYTDAIVTFQSNNLTPSDIIKWYTRLYLTNDIVDNVIMVGTGTGSSLQLNYNAVNTDTTEIGHIKSEIIKDILTTTTLANQS